MDAKIKVETVLFPPSAQRNSRLLAGLARAENSVILRLSPYTLAELRRLCEGAAGRSTNVRKMRFLSLKSLGSIEIYVLEDCPFEYQNRH